MQGIVTNVHVINPFGLGVVLIAWLALFLGTHVLVTFARQEPLVGWAVGPLGVTVLFLREPSLWYIWLDVICPALVSGGVLYIGLFSTIAPIALPHHPLFEAFIIACGVCITSMRDVVNALRDVRYPLWGEARILRSMQLLRSTWTKIHFTPFGYNYLNDHFGGNPTELLRAF